MVEEIWRHDIANIIDEENIMHINIFFLGQDWVQKKFCLIILIWHWSPQQLLIPIALKIQQRKHCKIGSTYFKKWFRNMKLRRRTFIICMKAVFLLGSLKLLKSLQVLQIDEGGKHNQVDRSGCQRLNVLVLMELKLLHWWFLRVKVYPQHRSLTTFLQTGIFLSQQKDWWAIFIVWKGWNDASIQQHAVK